MKKAELIAKLEGAKELTSVVSIDLVIAALGMLEDESPKAGSILTQEAAEEISDRIRRCLDFNSGDLVELNSAEFELGYDNRVELSRVDIDVDCIMSHVDAIMDEYTFDEVADIEAE
jgi:hypothetical protein